MLDDEFEAMLGATEGVDRGSTLCRTVPLVRVTPLTTRGGVGLGVTFIGVEYVEFVLRLYELVVTLFGTGDVARLRSLEKCVSSSLATGIVWLRCI